MNENNLNTFKLRIFNYMYLYAVCHLAWFKKGTHMHILELLD